MLLPVWVCQPGHVICSKYSDVCGCQCVVSVKHMILLSARPPAWVGACNSSGQPTPLTHVTYICGARAVATNNCGQGSTSGPWSHKHGMTDQAACRLVWGTLRHVHTQSVVINNMAERSGEPCHQHGCLGAQTPTLSHVLEMILLSCMPMRQCYTCPIALQFSFTSYEV